jgi:hypothetical protein
MKQKPHTDVRERYNYSKYERHRECARVCEGMAEEIKSTPLLEGDKIRGLEYVIEENGMWIRFHPSQYQESGTNKLKEYKVENEIVRGVDENEGSLSDGKYARSVKFVAAIAK